MHCNAATRTVSILYNFPDRPIDIYLRKILGGRVILNTSRRPTAVFYHAYDCTFY